MQFNHTLNGLDDQAILAFKDKTLKVRELQYAVDLAFLGDLADEFVALLKTQGIEIDVRTFDSDGCLQALSSQAWFREGVKCEAFQPGKDTSQKGKLSLRVSLEFLPENVDNSIS